MYCTHWFKFPFIPVEENRILRLPWNLKPKDTNINQKFTGEPSSAE